MNIITTQLILQVSSLQALVLFGYLVVTTLKDPTDHKRAAAKPTSPRATPAVASM